MKKITPILFLLFFAVHFYGQNVDYAREVLSKLSGKSFHGRGYVNKGDEKAAKYIAREFQRNGIQMIDSTYFQTYHFPINTLQGKMSVKIDGIKLNPGLDYVISCSSPSVEGSYSLIYLPDTITTDSGFLKTIEEIPQEKSYLVSEYYPRKIYGKPLEKIQGVIILDKNTPGWHVSNGKKIEKTVWLKVKKSAIPKQSKQINISVTSQFIEKHETQNVLGFVKGKSQPERFIVFAAHYDHLGMMGKKTYFPGANDNGSGTAMVLDLSRHFALPENQPDYSIAFMLVSGEEAGLYGSSYYAENPLFPLEQIRMFINLDMVGTGSEGITVVNGKAYKDVMDSFETINKENNYLTEIKSRGESCNSDHCPFYQKGVKSIFIYTRGKEHRYYHTVTDTDENFPFTAYNGLFKLLTKYVETIH